MTTKQTDNAAVRLRKARRVVETQLSQMRADLEQLQVQLSTGRIEGLADSVRATDEIRQWLRIAMEMEVRLEQVNGEKNGRDGSRDINLDEARSQIGCRLDRLRRTRCPGRFPE
jgi:hypothetical protein